MNQPGKRTNGPMNQPGNGRMKQCARERRTARRTLVDGSHRLRFSPRTPRGGRRDPQPHRRQVLDHTARNAHGVGGGGGGGGAGEGASEKKVFGLVNPWLERRF